MRIDRKPAAQTLQSTVPPVFDIHRGHTTEVFEYGRPIEERAAFGEKQLAKPSSNQSGIHARSE